MRTAAVAALFLPLALLSQDAPPNEAGPFRAPDLVELVTLDPTVRLDVRYASAKNGFGRPFYPRRAPSSSAPRPRRSSG